MSTISDALKKSRQARILVECDMGGYVLRISDENVSVPSSTGDAKIFHRLVLNDLSVGSSFSISSFTYAVQSASIVMSNVVPKTVWRTGRICDCETQYNIDGAIGRIFVWCPGLTWEDTEKNGCIHRGVCAKTSHDDRTYSFTITDETAAKFHTVPAVTINENTWPTHRTEGGGGSVSGKAQQLVFGDWPKGIPLSCVNISAYKYLAMLGIALSADAEYTAGTENVYDSDGAVIDAAYHTLYKRLDNEGNTVTYFDFSADQIDSEPLSCSMRGIYDALGDITGTAGTLIEHPADILRYLAIYHSDVENIDTETLKTLKAILPGLKYAAIINSQTDGLSITDRILNQCLAARVIRPGGIGCMTFDINGVIAARIQRDTDTIQRPIITPTDESLIVNDIEVKYAINPTTGAYEGSLTRNRTNDDRLKESYHRYGSRPKVTLSYPDVRTDGAAATLVSRYIDVYAMRHNLVKWTVPWWIGWDVREGDSALLTLKEGPSSDGNGYINERAILLDKNHTADGIAQTWWMVRS